MKISVEKQAKVEDTRNSRDTASVDAPTASLTTPAKHERAMADSDDTTTSSNSPAFQFYPKDFLGDGDQAGMSLQETGAYARLMCYEWNAHGQGISDDVVRCARMVGAPISAMRKMWLTLRALFIAHPTEPGRIVHPRLEKERAKQAVFKRRQSDASKKRWGSRGNAAASSGDMPQPIPKGSSSVFDLQSSNPVRNTDPGKERQDLPRARTTSGVMAGTLPRDHLNCHQPCVRVCISEKQHVLLLARHGGTDADLDAFYADVRRRLAPDVPIGDKPWNFWDAQFAAKFGSAAQPVNSKTAGNAAAVARFIARGQA